MVPEQDKLTHIKHLGTGRSSMVSPEVSAVSPSPTRHTDMTVVTAAETDRVRSHSCGSLGTLAGPVLVDAPGMYRDQHHSLGPHSAQAAPARATSCRDEP